VIFLIPLLLSPQGPAPEGDLMEKVMEAVDQVKQGFINLDRQLHISMEKVDANPEGGSELRKSLVQATLGAENLLLKMEALLAVLPERENQSSQGESQRSRRNQEEGENEEFSNGRNSPGPESRDDNSESVEGLENNVAPGLLLNPRPGSWGALPPRLQKALQQISTDGLPLKYRKWLKAYHRRHKSPQ
tara:strand:+ start:434 stop:1000 length:567 start_codon:yes stop_codon:yes gene_type:complete